MKKIKICYLITQAKGGGIATLGKLFCQHAANSGAYTPTFLTIKPHTSWSIESDEFKFDTLNCVDMRQSPKLFLDWLNKNPQDIIFFNGVSEVDKVIPYLPAEVYCVYGVHDVSIAHSINAVKYIDQIDKTITVSNYMYNVLSERYNNAIGNLAVINNGISIATYGNSSKENSLVFMGGDKPLKGMFELIAVLKRLKRTNFSGVLYWCGEISDKEFQKDLKAKYSFIHFMGLLTNREIIEVLAKSKVLLQLSRSESFGLATVEAMSQGCIPIAWDINSGTKDIITSGENGFFVKPLVYKRYVRQIYHVLEHHDNYYMNAINTVKSKFSAVKMFENYDESFQQMISSNPKVKPLSGKKYIKQVHSVTPSKFSFLGVFKQLIKKRINRSFWLSVKLNKYRGI